MKDTVTYPLSAIMDEESPAKQLERELVEARKDALEDAAQVCDSESSCEGIAQKCAVAIRAMKEGWK